MYHLNPTVNKEPWAAKDLSILYLLHQQIGPKWSRIGKAVDVSGKTLLAGRTDSAIKNQWYTKMVKKINNGDYSPPTDIILEPIILLEQSQYASTPSSYTSGNTTSEDDDEDGSDAQKNKVKSVDVFRLVYPPPSQEQSKLAVYQHDIQQSARKPLSELAGTNNMPMHGEKNDAQPINNNPRQEVVHPAIKPLIDLDGVNDPDTLGGLVELGILSPPSGRRRASLAGISSVKYKDEAYRYYDEEEKDAAAAAAMMAGASQGVVNPRGLSSSPLLYNLQLSEPDPEHVDPLPVHTHISPSTTALPSYNNTNRVHHSQLPPRPPTNNNNTSSRLPPTKHPRTKESDPRSIFVPINVEIKIAGERKSSRARKQTDVYLPTNNNKRRQLSTVVVDEQAEHNIRHHHQHQPIEEQPWWPVVPDGPPPPSMSSLGLKQSLVQLALQSPFDSNGCPVQLPPPLGGGAGNNTNDDAPPSSTQATPMSIQALQRQLIMSMQPNEAMVYRPPAPTPSSMDKVYGFVEDRVAQHRDGIVKLKDPVEMLRAAVKEGDELYKAAAASLNR